MSHRRMGRLWSNSARKSPAKGLKSAEGEAVFAVEPEVELPESVGFNGREFSRAEDLIDDNLELIRQKWAEHLG